MDSGNSGSLSLQSSSGGGGADDEFDSRCGADSSPLSELLRQQPPPAPSSGVLPGFGGGGPFYGIQELATPPLSHWSSSTPLPSGGTTGSGGAPPSLPPPPPSSWCQQGVVAVSAAGSHQNQEAAAPPRGSRKRTRASRRAPTTVLTTDTSNFRAMVQEFTGIPAPPFARSRLDHLYPSLSGYAGTPLAPYLLRPFAHNKLQAASPYYPPFVPASSSPANNKAGIVATSTTALSAKAVAATSGSYQQSGGGYLPFYQSTIGAQLDGNGGARYGPASHVHPMFDATCTTSAHAQRPLAHGFVNSSEATHLHLHRDLGRGGDKLSGLVRGSSRSVSIPDGGCNNTTTHSSSGAGPGAASRAGPLLGRNTQSATTPTPAVGATATMKAQAGVDSWICSTSD